MVTIASVDSTILVSLMYTRADNFTGQVLYKDLNTAYLHPKAAAALHKAQQILRRILLFHNLMSAHQKACYQIQYGAYGKRIGHDDRKRSLEIICIRCLSRRTGQYDSI